MLSHTLIPSKVGQNDGAGRWRHVAVVRETVGYRDIAILKTLAIHEQPKGISQKNGNAFSITGFSSQKGDLQLLKTASAVHDEAEVLVLTDASDALDARFAIAPVDGRSRERMKATNLVRSKIEFRRSRFNFCCRRRGRHQESEENSAPMLHRIIPTNFSNK